MSRRKLLMFGMVALVSTGIYLALNYKSILLPPCMFYEITGLYCPGCGSTRAVFRLTHGDLAGALRANALFLLIVPFLLLLVGSQAISWLPGKRYKPVDVPNWVAYSVVCVLILYWIARNIPLYPFYVLAPK